MQHVALITTSYPDTRSGSEAAGSFVEDFARELSRRVRVTVVAASSSDSIQQDGNLTIRKFSVPRLPLSLLSPSRPNDWIAILRTLRAGRSAVEALAVEDRPDLLFGLWVLPSGYWARRVSQRHGIPYSVWALGSDIWALSKVPFVRSILKTTLRRAQRRFADGLQLARDVESLCGLDCEFLPSTRKLPSISGNSSGRATGRRLAFLGRWHVNKGADLLLDALDMLVDDDWAQIDEVRICGGGPLNDRIHSSIRSLATAGRPVVVQGYLDRHAAASLIHWSDYLLLPSRIESIPVIFSDAMQMRTPVVATPVGDLPGLIERYNAGILAAEPTADAFAKAIRAAIQQEPASFQPGTEKAAREFDLERATQRFVDFDRPATVETR